jgi:cell fate (sporulation/competence/biofilm development) regulator YmcA (YheA/YmcA/DUF963 family)
MNNIEQKLNELMELLKNQEELKRYKLIENKLNDNETIMERIDEYKKMQQKVVLYETRNDDLPQEVSNKLDRVYEELFDIPIYSEYIDLQTELNEVIQHITTIIENAINMEDAQ